MSGLYDNGTSEEPVVVISTPDIQEPAKPWGVWPTLGLSAAIGIITFIVQLFLGLIIGIIFAVAELDFNNLAENGNFLLGCTLLAYPVILGLTLLVIKIRKGNTPVDYLAIRNLKLKPLLCWLGWTACMILVTGVIGSQLDKPPPEIMITMIASSHMILMIVVLIFGAPIVEEIFFRGFMFKGIAASSLGGVGAVIITTLCWVGIHGFQYDLFTLLQLSVFGVLLGIARLKTNSVIIPVILHMANNAFAVGALKLYLTYGEL